MIYRELIEHGKQRFVIGKMLWTALDQGYGCCVNLFVDGTIEMLFHGDVELGSVRVTEVQTRYSNTKHKVGTVLKRKG